MKVNLHLLICLLWLCSIKVKADHFVYICTGPYAEKYHSTPYCSGLNRCSGKIIKSKISTAKSKSYEPCNKCVGYSYYEDEDDEYERYQRAEIKKLTAEKLKKQKMTEKLKKSIVFRTVSVCENTGSYTFNPLVDYTSLLDDSLTVGLYKNIESWTLYEKRRIEEDAIQEQRSEQNKKFQNRRKTNIALGIGGLIRGTWGIGFCLDIFIDNIDLDISACWGTNSSKGIYWYNANGQVNNEPAQYKPVSFSFRSGYGFDITRHIKITPLLGINHTLIHNRNNQQETPQHTYVSSLSPSIKLNIAFNKYLGLSITPEYNIQMAQGKLYDAIQLIGDNNTKWGKGIGCSLFLNIIM